MASEKAKVTIYTCDDPKCPTRLLVETDELPDGFHGDVIKVDSTGGRGGKWFACQNSHIQAAVEAAATREEQP